MNELQNRQIRPVRRKLGYFGNSGSSTSGGEEIMASADESEDIGVDRNECVVVEEDDDDGSDGGSDSGGDDDLAADVLDFEEKLLRDHVPDDMDDAGGDEENEDEFLAEAENMLYRALKNPINNKVFMRPENMMKLRQIEGHLPNIPIHYNCEYDRNNFSRLYSKVNMTRDKEALLVVELLCVSNRKTIMAARAEVMIMKTKTMMITTMTSKQCCPGITHTIKSPSKAELIKF